MEEKEISVSEKYSLTIKDAYSETVHPYYKS